MNRWQKALVSPQKTIGEALSIASPSLFWEIYRRRALSQGFTSLFLTFSFDCDTVEDAEVVLEVDDRLRDVGVTAAYAVPGEILKKNESTYRKLLDRGAHFLNHGYKTHTIWNRTTEKYESIFFYDGVSSAQVKEDIEMGHATLTQFLGREPKGFRVPHFGTYQRPSNLRFLHQVLSGLNYEYSSSTVPVQSLWLGPVGFRNKLYEIPVSGLAAQPKKIFDSWGLNSDEYFKGAEQMCALAKEKALVGVLNYYADPSQVHGQNAFFESMKMLARVAAPMRLEELPTIRRAQDRALVLGRHPIPSAP